MIEQLYTGYFGLAEPPFTITPDPRYLYMSERHREALAHLLYAVRQGGGFVQLTGEVGTGKTTLCRCLLAQLPPAVDVALILTPHLVTGELLRAVCDELRITYPQPATSKMLVDALHQYLLDAHKRGRHTVLIVDEAQELPAGVLEEIRLLTNLETTRHKLLQIILIGQPELVPLLRRRRLRQLAQRITARYHLEPFSGADTRAYVRHRLRVAGANREIFRNAALRRVHVEASGVPRLINVICDRALLGAYTEREPDVDARTVARAAREIRGMDSAWRQPFRWKTVAAGLAVAVIAGGAGLLASPLARHLVGTAPFASDEPRVAGRNESRAESGRAEGQPAAAVAMSLTARPRLAQLLADPAVRTDQASAFAALYPLWGIAPPATSTGQSDCDAARLHGLRCLFRTGTWTTLRRYNLPAILELTGAGGKKHYAAVAALSADSVTLALDGRPLSVPQGEVTSLWTGDFILVWKPPSLSTPVLAPGMSGKDVEWLRQRLGAHDARAMPASNRRFYDDELRDRVISFQRSRSLAPDGIVGDETLTHLATAIPDLGVPLLSGKE